MQEQLNNYIEKIKQDYRRVQKQFDEFILAEKDHFKRIKDFEEACDLNDDLRSKAGL